MRRVGADSKCGLCGETQHEQDRSVADGHFPVERIAPVLIEQQKALVIAVAAVENQPVGAGLGGKLMVKDLIQRPPVGKARDEHGGRRDAVPGGNGGKGLLDRGVFGAGGCREPEIIPGVLVKVKNDQGKVVEYKIVGSSQADSLNFMLSDESPVGRALKDSKKGDTVKIETPAGTLKYKVMEIWKD